MLFFTRTNSANFKEQSNLIEKAQSSVWFAWQIKKRREESPCRSTRCDKLFCLVCSTRQLWNPRALHRGAASVRRRRDDRGHRRHATALDPAAAGAVRHCRLLHRRMHLQGECVRASPLSRKAPAKRLFWHSWTIFFIFVPSLCSLHPLCLFSDVVRAQRAAYGFLNSWVIRRLNCRCCQTRASRRSRWCSTRTWRAGTCASGT